MNTQSTTQYTITELAREFDVTPRAIRFYEDQGLLSPSREGSGGLRRVYSGRDRTRLKLTLRGKRLGFTLSEIRDLLDVYESPTDTVPQLQAFLGTVAQHREVLERQLEDLNATLDDLAQYEAQARALLDSGTRERGEPKAAASKAVSSALAPESGQPQTGSEAKPAAKLMRLRGLG